jgi:hypothetical protein
MTLSQIHDEIEHVSERRTALWQALSEGHDPAVTAELARLSDRLDTLWDAERAVKAALRFGDRERIVARARVEERLSGEAMVKGYEHAYERAMAGEGA